MVKSPAGINGVVVPLTNWNTQFALLKAEPAMALFKKPDAVMYCAPNGTNVLVLLSSTPNPVAVGIAVIPLAGDDQMPTDITKPAIVIHKCLYLEKMHSCLVKNIMMPSFLKSRLTFAPAITLNGHLSDLPSAFSPR